jgi:hypothetical protein
MDLSSELISVIAAVAGAVVSGIFGLITSLVHGKKDRAAHPPSHPHAAAAHPQPMRKRRGRSFMLFLLLLAAGGAGGYYLSGLRSGAQTIHHSSATDQDPPAPEVPFPQQAEDVGLELHAIPPDLEPPPLSVSNDGPPPLPVNIDEPPPLLFGTDEPPPLPANSSSALSAAAQRELQAEVDEVKVRISEMEEHIRSIANDSSIPQAEKQATARKLREQYLELKAMLDDRERQLRP